MAAIGSFRRARSVACWLSIALPLILTSVMFVAPPAAAQASEETTPASEETSEAPEKGMTVSRMAICEDIEDREPVGAAGEFPSDVGALYCFSEIDRADPPVQIFHRWYIGDRLVNEIPITARASHWRCWSRKIIRERWKGECRVEVATEEGDVLRVAAFTLE